MHQFAAKFAKNVIEAENATCNRRYTAQSKLRVNNLNLIAKIRQQRKPWARRVLGVFVMVWLNVALQPCAMALDDAHEHGCQHCPQLQAEEGASHGSHEPTASRDSEPACDTSASPCAFLDDFNYDGRTAKLKVEDTQGEIPACLVSSNAVFALQNNSEVLSGSIATSYAPGHRPPLNVLHCVYLI